MFALHKAALAAWALGLHAGLAAAQAGGSPGPAAPPANVPPGQAALRSLLERAYTGQKPPEAVRMLLTIAGGGRMSGGEGWFGPAQTRYTFAWLAQAHGRAGARSVGKDEFRGPPGWFTALDRDKDGRLGPADLDWSDTSPYQVQSALASRLFRRMNKAADDKLTAAEWAAFFREASKGKDALTAEELRDALLAPAGRGGRAGGRGPSPAVLVRGLFRNEVGSMQEGPRVGERAPDFVLSTHDGKERLHLIDRSARKPTVLVFGNYTCRPFRASYPGVDAVCQRYRGQATFRAVYVREAHPNDGWSANLDVLQPRTYKERLAVAGRCFKAVKYSIPLLVDEINDPAGNAYSGMPSRLYVIDQEGKVAYKSGRGPMGFKPAEMEQALVMALLEQHLKTATTAAGAKDR
jgi:hypothetical protein